MHLTVNMIYKQELTYEHKSKTSAGTEEQTEPTIREEAWSSSQELQRELASCRDAHHCDPTEQAACFLSPCRSILVFSFIGLSVFPSSCHSFRWINAECLNSPAHISASLYLTENQLTPNHLIPLIFWTIQGFCLGYIFDLDFSTCGVLGPRNQQKERKMFFSPKIVKTVKCFLV